MELIRFFTENDVPNIIETAKQIRPYMATSNINLIILYVIFLLPKYQLININKSTPLIISELITSPNKPSDIL